MEKDGIWAIRCYVIMPDHIHLLVRLGSRLPLGKSIARLKAKTSSSLRAHDLRWQPGYFDHRIRPTEDRLPYFLYTYLNPYRAGLLPATSKWQGFHCGKEDLDWLVPLLADGLPEPAWLARLP